MTRSEAIDRSDPQLTAALAGPKAMLESDGFEATWEVDAANGIHFTVSPGSAECQDCLVPKPVMEAILADALDGTPWSVAEVTLPADKGQG
jgi:hypothetical protein